MGNRMSKPKLTKWFDGRKFVPAHVGWWHTSYSNLCPLDGVNNESNYNWWWDGSSWMTRPGEDICYSQDRWFRGLAEKP